MTVNCGTWTVESSSGPWCRPDRVALCLRIPRTMLTRLEASGRKSDAELLTEAMFAGAIAYTATIARYSLRAYVSFIILWLM